MRLWRELYSARRELEETDGAIKDRGSFIPSLVCSSLSSSPGRSFTVLKSAEGMWKPLGDAPGSDLFINITWKDKGGPADGNHAKNETSREERSGEDERNDRGRLEEDNQSSEKNRGQPTKRRTCCRRSDAAH